MAQERDLRAIRAAGLDLGEFNLDAAVEHQFDGVQQRNVTAAEAG